MRLPEKLLLFFSRNPEHSDYNKKQIEHGHDEPLKLLVSEFSNFDELVRGRKLLDFGCGRGHQSIPLVERYNCQVVGIDIYELALSKAISSAAEKNIPAETLRFTNNIAEIPVNTFDIALSHNSFEHFDDPAEILKNLARFIHENGKIIITFGPPWLAPYGSHMHFFTRLPWVHVLFSEKTVMRVRKVFRDDSDSTYQEAGLNKMTISKFEALITSSGLRIIYKQYSCIKGITFLSKIPLVRELFINHVSVLLSKSK